MDAQIIARIAHEADRAFLASLGDMTTRTWFATDAVERERAVVSVRAAQDNPKLTAPELHRLWSLDRRSNGWTWADRYDEAAKTDPRLVAFGFLPFPAQRRGHLFVSVVRGLSSTPTRTP